MPVFEYKAVDEAGKIAEGIIDADSPRDARGKLRTQKLYTTKLSESTEEITITSEVKVKKLFKIVRPKDVAVMTRQLSTLIKSGMPVLQSLSAIIEQLEGHPFQPVLYDVRDKINSGSSLAEALEDHPKYFSQLYVNMIRAGESSGALDSILGRMADYLEANIKQRNRIRSIIVYPIFMLFVGTGVLVFLMTTIVPILTKLFEEMGQSLPAPTKALIAASKFLNGYGLIMLIILAVAIFLLKRYTRSESGRLIIDRIKLRLPIFGAIIRKISISRFARTLGTLLTGGTSIVNAMDIVKKVVGNEVLGRVIDQVKERVIQGETIAEPLKQSRQFPPIVVHMVSVGEVSGNLEEMLLNIADTYDNEVDTTVSGLNSILEPIMIIVMGVVVGFIVLAILLPIFQMNQFTG